jgi:hypothetical protein
MKTFRTLGDLRALPTGENRTVEFIISSERKDRHGTVLNMDGWVLDSYRKNPIVGYQHDVYGDSLKGPDPDNVIGVAKVYQEGSYLIGAVTFEPADINPTAEKIFRKVKNGSLRAASVGFLPLDNPVGSWGKGDEAQGAKNATFYYGRRELLEFSIVNIPSNSDAVRRQFEQRQLQNLFTPANNAAAAMKMKLQLALLDEALETNRAESLRRMKREMLENAINPDPSAFMKKILDIVTR